MAQNAQNKPRRGEACFISPCLLLNEGDGARTRNLRIDSPVPALANKALTNRGSAQANTSPEITADTTELAKRIAAMTPAQREALKTLLGG